MTIPPTPDRINELAEKVRDGLVDGNEYSCGCDDPGNPQRCIHVERFAAISELAALAAERDQAVADHMAEMERAAGLVRELAALAATAAPLAEALEPLLARRSPYPGDLRNARKALAQYRQTQEGKPQDVRAVGQQLRDNVDGNARAEACDAWDALT